MNETVHGAAVPVDAGELGDRLARLRERGDELRRRL